MNIWNDRIVLPDGTVVMPEQVNRIDLMTHNDNAAILVGDQWLSLNGARIDHCTFLTDKNGTMIYERDKVTDNYGKVHTVYQARSGAWRINGASIRYWSDIIEITGMEPYSAEADNE